MIRNTAIWIGIAAMLATAAVCSADEVFPVVHTDTIAVRVMDGLNGKPRVRTVVVVVGGYSERDLDAGLWRQEVLTDDTGALLLTDGLRNLPLLRVEAIKLRSCGVEGFGRTFSMELTRRDGQSGSNRCGTATVRDAAGTLTVFVADKKPLFKKRLKDGSAGARASGQPERGAPVQRAAVDAMFFNLD